jgi:hypothetical protein
MAIDLTVGGVGLYAMFFEVVFGFVYLGIPFADWELYFLLGVQNVPLILAVIYATVIVSAAMTYALFWRHLLFRVGKLQSVSVGFATVALASTAIVFSTVPGILGDLCRIWLASITGTPSKFWAIFGLLPLTGVSIGSFVGRTAVIRRWTRSRRLVVETAHWRWGIVKSRRLLAVQG